MSLLRKSIYVLLGIIALPLAYVLIALVLSSITVDRVSKSVSNNAADMNLSRSLSNSKMTTIYLHSNGVHMDVAIKKEDASALLLRGIVLKANKPFLSFGWGDENFYLHTPTWGDLSVGTALNALFLQSSSLMHLTHYSAPESDWIPIQVSDNELARLNQYLQKSFQTDSKNNKILLKNKGYTPYDDFYKAVGSYSMFNTCNTWVNRGFKESGLKSSYWTVFDFGLLNKYQS